METEPLRPADPASGYHRVISRRPFRYIERDPAHSLRVTWIATPISCPACETDSGLQLVLDERTDVFVQVHCPRRRDHTWSEPRIDRGHFLAYSRLEWAANPDPDLMWIIDAGFGEKPPPPLDIDEVKAAAKTVGRVLKGRAKSKVRSTVRKPVRAAKSRAQRAAAWPVTATVRAVRGRREQRGGQDQEQPATAKRGRPVQLGPDGAPMKVPSVAKYRKAYGVSAPKRGPKCLVCEDARTIPGTRIPCTECAPARGT